MSRVRKIFHWCNRSFLVQSRSMCNEAVYTVNHDPESSKFYIQLCSNAEAKLEYDIEKGNVIDLYHTEVPPSYQGKGIAAVLAQAAFDFAVKNQMKMRLSCSYLQKYYRENPKEEYQKLVV